MQNKDSPELKRQGTASDETDRQHDTPHADDLRAFAAEVERHERLSAADIIDYEATRTRKEITHVYFDDAEGSR